jgi:hypothetical protein
MNHHFFAADRSYIRKTFSRFGGVNADHSEQCIPVLMPTDRLRRCRRGVLMVILGLIKQAMGGQKAA